MTIRVYEYGLLPPKYNAQLVHEQMVLGHRYRNKLVEIERQRRDKVRGALSSHPDVSLIEAQIAELSTVKEEMTKKVKQARKQARRRAESPGQREDIRAVSAQLAGLRTQVKAARAAIASDVGIASLIEEANSESDAAVRAARAACGVYWGTYLLHEADMSAARKSKTPPDFVSWRGDGRVSVQLQGGRSVQQIMEGASEQLQIVASERPGQRRRQGRNYLVRMRVSSSKTEEDRRPAAVWAEWTLIMHREIPASARIKVATVSMRRRGPFVDWRLQITVDLSACARRPIPSDGAVALNLGFALRPNDAIRVGYLVGTDDFEDEILVQKSDAYRHGADGAPADTDNHVSIQRRLAAADRIRSQRDNSMNDMKLELVRGLAERRELSGVNDDTPEDLAKLLENIPQWRSPRRIAALVKYWPESWWPEMRETIAAWHKRDVRLWQEETGTRTSAQRDRKEGYRMLASRMAARYRTLVIDDTDLRKFQRSPRVDEERTEFDAVKLQQRIAAPSDLRLALIHAFGDSRIDKRSAVNVTRRHHTCGTLVERNDESREMNCPTCNVTYDQDANACRNLLREHLSADHNSETARAGKSSEPRMSRSERLRAAKASPSGERDRSKAVA